MSKRSEQLEFEERLYNMIRKMDLWSEDELVIKDEGIAFPMSNIADRPDYNAVGSLSFDIPDSDSMMVFANLSFILAMNADRDNLEAVKLKLYELNMNFRSGLFYIDEFRHLCYTAKFPVYQGNVEETIKSFIAEYKELSDYLDVMYTYLLRVISTPDKADLKEYLMALMNEADSVGALQNE